MLVKLANEYNNSGQINEREALTNTNSSRDWPVFSGVFISLLLFVPLANMDHVDDERDVRMFVVAGETNNIKSGSSSAYAFMSLAFGLNSARPEIFRGANLVR